MADYSGSDQVIRGVDHQHTPECKPKSGSKSMLMKHSDNNRTQHKGCTHYSSQHSQGCNQARQQGHLDPHEGKAQSGNDTLRHRATKESQTDRKHGCMNGLKSASARGPMNPRMAPRITVATH